MECLIAEDYARRIPYQGKQPTGNLQQSVPPGKKSLVIITNKSDVKPEIIDEQSKET